MKRHAVQSWYTLCFQVKTKSQAVQSYLGTKNAQRSVVQESRSAGVSANFRFKVFKWRRKVRQSYLGAKSAQCSAVQYNAVQCTAVHEAEGAPASCSCLHRSLISTFQNAILWNTTNTYSKIRKYRRNIAHCSYSIAETALMTRPSNFWFTTRNKTQSKQKQNRASTPTS